MTRYCVTVHGTFAPDATWIEPIRCSAGPSPRHQVQKLFRFAGQAAIHGVIALSQPRHCVAWSTIWSCTSPIQAFGSSGTVMAETS